MSKIVYILMYFLTINSTFCQENYKMKRVRMVETQLKTREIKDLATLRAMSSVPRHEFVPNHIKQHAYSDSPLPIGYDQTISQPYIVAFMTQELKLDRKDRVLEIGTGSGYQAAVLAVMVDSVFTIEIVKELGFEAKKRLNRLHYNNLVVKIGDGYHGWKEKAPFDAIIVTAAVDTIPKPLLDQLKEGGRMIIPVGPNKYDRNLILATKKNGKIRTKTSIPVRFVPFTRDNKSNGG